MTETEKAAHTQTDSIELVSIVDLDLLKPNDKIFIAIGPSTQLDRNSLPSENFGAFPLKKLSLPKNINQADPNAMLYLIFNRTYVDVFRRNYKHLSQKDFSKMEKSWLDQGYTLLSTDSKTVLAGYRLKPQKTSK